MRWSLPRDNGVETLAGFLLGRFGHIPQPGEHTEFDGHRFTVMEMDGRRISRVRVRMAKLAPQPEPDAEAESDVRR